MAILMFGIAILLLAGTDKLIEAYQDRKIMRDLRIIINNLRDAYEIPELACDKILSQLSHVRNERRRDKILKSFETKWKEDYRRRQRQKIQEKD